MEARPEGFERGVLWRSRGGQRDGKRGDDPLAVVGITGELTPRSATEPRTICHRGTESQRRQRDGGSRAGRGERVAWGEAGGESLGRNGSHFRLCTPRYAAGPARLPQAPLPL